MRPRSLILLTIAMGWVHFLGTPSWADPNINIGHMRQCQRPTYAPRGARISWMTLERLCREHCRTQHFRMRAAPNGHLGVGERHRLQRIQIKVGKHIQRVKNMMEFSNPCRVTLRRPHGQENSLRVCIR